MGFSNTGLEELRSALAGFAAERDWGRFHSPRNLVLALVGEVRAASFLRTPGPPAAPGQTAADAAAPHDAAAAAPHAAAVWPPRRSASCQRSSNGVWWLTAPAAGLRRHAAMPQAAADAGCAPACACTCRRGEVAPGLPDFSAADKAHVGQEMSDVLLYLVRLADVCGVDLGRAVLDKLEHNARK